MKHKISAVIGVALLTASAAVAIWIGFARTGPAVVDTSTAPSGPSASATSAPSASAKAAPSASPTLAVPTRRVDPRSGDSYCETAKLLGIYAHQPYGLDPELGVVKGRQFAQRLAVVASTYRRLGVQATKDPRVSAEAAKAWKALASAATSAHTKLQVTGYDVQSQVMIVELANLAKVSQQRLPTATASVTQTCNITSEELGF